ncbi:hypothetical protein [Paenibacillus elgii]|nr:hypothetical protein [Paenibacillus elgii]MCM3273975.1 hypothetical protein [Paenibacillus elgii]
MNDEARDKIGELIGELETVSGMLIVEGYGKSSSKSGNGKSYFCII